MLQADDLCCDEGTAEADSINKVKTSTKNCGETTCVWLRRSQALLSWKHAGWCWKVAVRHRTSPFGGASTFDICSYFESWRTHMTRLSNRKDVQMPGRRWKPAWVEC